MGKRTRKPARKSGGRRWTADEARVVVQAWGASGLPLATFARKRGLCAERVRWWRQRLGAWEASREEPQRLVPAVVTNLPPPAAAASVTLRVAGNVVVEIADVGAVPAGWISALVTELARQSP